MAKKVYIGVGHGGSDSGAVANGFKEKDLNLEIAKACKAALERSGVSVKISRATDSEVWLEKRIEECNKYKPDVALDIHNNAGGGDGAEVFHTIYGGTGETLAKNILAEMQKIGQNSRGAKTKKNSSGKDYFGFIRDTVCPAALVECAFIDNKTDVKIIDTAAERKAMGEAIANALCKTLGVTYKPEEKKAAATSSNKIYRLQVGAYKDLNNAIAMRSKLKAAGFDAIIV
jgi:N-acetylmuramoyl-L-alanine amidase